MLIVRAPMRISYAGGGTDLESYYRQFGGLVVSAAIAKYFYVVITPNDDGALQVSSSDFRAFLRYEVEEGAMGIGAEIKHADAALSYFGLRSGYSIFMASEVPSGTGLGSSSAVAVALVKGIGTLLGRDLTKDQVAEQACEIELVKLKMSIGRQDQYASAFGGLNAIRFQSDGVRVDPIRLSGDMARLLEDSTLLFHTGMQHDSSELLTAQRRATESGHERTIDSLHTIKAMAEQAERKLRAGELDAIGDLMDASWQAKKKLSRGVTNERIDSAYEAARAAGALGGKIAGAGGGGFLLLYCPPAAQPSVSRVLHKQGLVRFDTRFDWGGARVLMNNVA